MLRHVVVVVLLSLGLGALYPRVAAQILPTRPVLLCHPQDVTLEEGGSTTLEVCAQSFLAMRYQWFRNGEPIEGATERVLTLTNLNLDRVGEYHVRVSNNIGGTDSEIAAVRLTGEPIIVRDIRDHSVSLGVDILLSVFSSGTSPLTYQWSRNGEIIEGAERPVLKIVAEDLGDGRVEVRHDGASPQTIAVDAAGLVPVGRYAVEVRNPLGRIVGREGTVEIDTAFTKVTTGPVVTQRGASSSGAWADYDQDGDLDLFVPGAEGSGNHLYLNDPSGNFIQVGEGAVVSDVVDNSHGAWGDFDNDGWVDLFVNSSGGPNGLYRNLGAGKFDSLQSQAVVEDEAVVGHPSWADFDRDGDLDLFIAKGDFAQPQPNALYENLGDGNFTLSLTSGLGLESAVSNGGVWGDYDNDGDLDLFVLNQGALEGSPNSLYRNNGDGSFSIVQDGAVAADLGTSNTAAFGDFNNDGWLDLVVGNQTGNLFLYRNEGGVFSRVTEGAIAESVGLVMGLAWGDFDNDGWLDLFCGNWGDRNLFFRNTGEGDFVAVSSGSPVNDPGLSEGVTWGDYDGNGFLDLLVANSDGNNLLYQNTGNGNHWLRVIPIGQRSNRSGIGVRVFVKTLGAGAEQVQLREIVGGDGGGMSMPLEASFGLGSSSAIDSVRIEWPSGIVQELHDVEVDQVLRVTEPDVTIEPGFLAVLEGASVTLNVTSSLEGEYRYAWQLDGVEIPDAMETEFRIDSISAENVGRYSLLIEGVGSGDTISVSSDLELGIPPSIFAQPLSQAVTADGTAQFTVEALANPAPTYQWQFNGQDLEGGTGPTLSLEGVTLESLGEYRVVISNEFGSMTSQIAVLSGLPSFRSPPSGYSSGLNAVPIPGPGFPPILTADISVSLGADIIILGEADGLPPLEFQWQFDGEALEGETGSTLVLRGISSEDAGVYRVVVKNGLGVVTSEGVAVSVDPRFTKITHGPLIEDGGGNDGAVWGDFDNDNDLDLFSPQREFVVQAMDNFLYENLGDGEFSRVTQTPVTEAGGASTGGAWIDIDNNDTLDLFVVNTIGPNQLYLNRGSGAFEPVVDSGIETGEGNVHFGSSWADYDNDGFVDLFLTTYSGDKSNFLFRNNGAGGFLAATEEMAGDIVTDVSNSGGGLWADYDNDGDSDIYVYNFPQFGTEGFVNWLYQNNGDGTFSRVTEGAIAEDVGGITATAAWADYDNDGFLDLFVGNSTFEGNFLYRNLGDGSFERITEGPLVEVIAPVQTGSAWGDYDNDGDQDLFVANGVFFGAVDNVLYENNGDGTFSELKTGSLVNDGGWSWHPSWQDYDNDGFLDLFVTNFTGTGSNFLYRNNGNENGWLRVSLKGTLSNRSGIGAKVRILVTIGGEQKWLMREISTGGYSSPSSLDAHFGVGDAESIDTLRIEWPSGIAQVSHNLSINQSLTIVEGLQLSALRHKGSEGIELVITAKAGGRYTIESSTDLNDWVPLPDIVEVPEGEANLYVPVVVNVTAGGIVDSDARFFRVVELP